jgi:uncharacterized protein (DUF433 family)
LILVLLQIGQTEADFVQFFYGFVDVFYNSTSPLLTPAHQRIKLNIIMDTEKFDRISLNPTVMGGRPCMRVTVGMIVGQIGAGHSIDELLVDFPYLEREDILQALQYAAWRVQDREVALVGAAINTIGA